MTDGISDERLLDCLQRSMEWRCSACRQLSFADAQGATLSKIRKQCSQLKECWLAVCKVTQGALGYGMALRALL